MSCREVAFSLRVAARRLDLPALAPSRSPVSIRRTENEYRAVWLHFSRDGGRILKVINTFGVTCKGSSVRPSKASRDVRVHVPFPLAPIMRFVLFARIATRENEDNNRKLQPAELHGDALDVKGSRYVGRTRIKN
ncbi:hypothetical protein EYF80_011719 [Liparis tanakae]|uniref:Uncharacterized protein n=1 Tax=Liparis tanakae TaxID=230148 RepID=A0A4Z2IJJ6_9TELE|nr:hypothetical protein EYF80_011719 [Liparis tanakae]